MAYCYFFKVSRGISWNDLKKLTVEQERANRRPTEYRAAVVLSVGVDLFNDICKDISTPQIVYQKYRKLATTLPDGTRNCIVIRNNVDSRQLVLYTVGRASPLYAGISESSNMLLCRPER